MSLGWPSLESLTFLWEVGTRAALHSQQFPRDLRPDGSVDLRWFKGLAERRR